jgi:hypothetical protein
MEEMFARKTAVLYLVVLALILSVIGCASPAPPVAEPPEASVEVVGARDAAVTFVREHFDEAPGASLSWVEERLTPEDLPGGAEWQYTAGEWVVKVSYAVLPPKWTTYEVAVSNVSTGFEWQGRVDGSGGVPEAPENVLVARDAAMHYVSEQHGQVGLGSGLAWQEEWVVGEGIVGAGGYRYASGDWVVTISYPVVAPESAVYEVLMVNESTGFQWEGKVDAQGAVTESSAAEVEEIFDRVAARDAALDHIYEQYKYPPLDQSVEWQEERLTGEGIVGAETFRYTAESWMVEVSYPVVAPEATIYQVTVTNEGLGLEWLGEVDAQGVVTEG